MSTEENKALIGRFYEEVFNLRNLVALDDFYAPIISITPSLLACQSVPREPGKPSPRCLKGFLIYASALRT